MAKVTLVGGESLRRERSRERACRGDARCRDGEGRETRRETDRREGLGTRAQVTSVGTCDTGEIQELGWDLDEPLAGVASGLNHAVAYTRGGAAYAWGLNSCGQLGNGTFTSASRPRRILQGVFVTAVAVGGEHTLALSSDGRLYAFGCNARGALGIGSSDLGRFPLPQVVTTPEPFVALAAAGAHSVGLAASGAVYTWGANNHGQLGLGGCARPGGPGGDSCLNDVHTPTKVTNTNEGGALPTVKLIAAGGGTVAGDAHDPKGGHTVVVTQEDVVYAWGDNSAGQLGVKQVYTNTSSPPYWNNTPGYTPNAYDATTQTYYNRRELPMRVEAHSILVKNGTRLQQSKTNMPAIKQIDAGNAHTIMLLETGEIFTWGDNYYGQLGLGYASRDNTPQMFYLTRNDPEPQMVDAPTRIRKFDYVVEEFDGANSSQTVYTTVTGCVLEENNSTFVQVSAGGDVSAAITSNNKLFVWGNNADGQLGTCGCGSCAMYGAADTGTCTLESSPDEECQCNCGGIGTCKFVPATSANNFVVQNVGKCANFTVLGKPKAMCNCTNSIMTGTLSVMDEPMQSSLSAKKSYNAVTYASIGGGSLFAVSESSCKDDDNGVVCSGRGICQSDGSCQCQEKAGGLTCENVCPVGTVEDKNALALFGLDDNEVTGSVCSNHGSCNPITALCECDEQFFGPRCSYICNRDEEQRICSGNGTCVYVPEISSLPYCECDRYQDAGTCAAKGLRLYPEGWCSYHGGDATGGFRNCYLAGACGNCDSPAARSSTRVLFVLALITALLLALPF